MKLAMMFEYTWKLIKLVPKTGFQGWEKGTPGQPGAIFCKPEREFISIYHRILYSFRLLLEIGGLVATHKEKCISIFGFDDNNYCVSCDDQNCVECSNDYKACLSCKERYKANKNGNCIKFERCKKNLA